MGIPHIVLVFFFFNDTATTEIYTLSLHDALPISSPPNHHSIHVPSSAHVRPHAAYSNCPKICTESLELGRLRSEEHTSELQSQSNLVCRLLLEKKNTPIDHEPHTHFHRPLTRSRT